MTRPDLKSITHLKILIGNDTDHTSRLFTVSGYGRSRRSANRCKSDTVSEQRELSHSRFILLTMAYTMLRREQTEAVQRQVQVMEPGQESARG